MADPQEQGPWTKYGPPPASTDEDGPWKKFASTATNSTVEPDLSGATPRLIEAAKTNSKVAEIVKPTQFEKDRTVSRWQKMNTPLPRPAGGGEEATLAEGAEPGLEGLSTIGMVGAPITMIRNPRMIVPIAKGIAKSVIGGVGGAAAGGYAGRQIGNIFGQPETGAQIGSSIGGLAGGFLGGVGKEPPIPEKGPYVPAAESPGAYRGPASVPKTTPEPNVIPAIQSPGPYRGPASVPKPAEQSPIGSISLPPQLQGERTLSSSVGTASVAPGPQPVKPMTPPQPFPRVQTRAEVAAAARPAIITPERGPVGPTIESEGRPATWTDEAVMDAASKGNRAAISQVGARRLDLKFAGDPRLNNIRYVMGDVDYRNLITSPREVTKFGPTGEPIRQEVAEPIGRNQDTVARASRTPRIVQAVQKQGEIPKVGTMPLNFERPIRVPSESGPVLLKPEAPPVEPPEAPKPKEGYQGPERRSSPREDTGERSWGFYKKMLREAVDAGDKEQEALAREGIKRTQGPVAPMTKPTPEGVLPGMGEHVAKQAEGAAQVKGEELSNEIRTPKNVEEAAGRIETKGPLFRGTEASPQGELLKPMQKPVEREPGEEPEPAEVKGTTEPIKTPKPRAEKRVPIEKRVDRDAITEAEGLLAQESSAMLAGDRPGVYFDEYGQNDPGMTYAGRRATKGAQAGGVWRGVKSGREMHPFMREHPEWGPEAVQKALRNKDSAAYQKMMEAAVDFNRRAKMSPEERAKLVSDAEKRFANFVPPKSKFLNMKKPQGD